MTRDEILNPSLGFSTQETRDYNDQYTQPATTPTKADLLSKKKDEKLFSLSGKVGKDDLTAKELDVGDNTLYMGNKILNDYSPAELNYFQSKRYAEAGVYPDIGADGQVQGYLEKDAQGNLVPFQGSQDDIRSLYLFGTQGREDVNKLGVSWDPEAYGRYEPKNGDVNTDAFGNAIGPAGVNRDDRKMALAYRGEEADLFEALRHGNKSTILSREYLNKVGGQDDSAYWDSRKEFGTGATEAYKGGLTGIFGSDAEQGLPEDIEQRYLDFKAKYGLTDKKQAVSGGTLQEKLLQRESDGSYKTVNDLGYVGGYQFGAQALETLGYLKEGASKQGNKVLSNPDAWTGKGGANSLESFLGSKELQDTAFVENAEFNLEQLQKNGLIDNNSTEAEVNGYLAAAHLLGANGAKDLDSEDAYGTKGREYFDLGAGTTGEGSVVKPLSLEDEIAAMKRSNMSGFDKVVEEAGQTVAGALAGIGQGALDVTDALQEGATYPAQLLYNAVTNENIDIDLFDDGLKKTLVQGLQDIVGYDQELDADSIRKAEELIEMAGVEAFSPSTWAKLLTTEEGRGALKEYLTNPSLTANSLTQIVGAGGALGAGVKVAGKVGTKVAPKLTAHVSKILQTNRNVISKKIQEAKLLPELDRAAAIKAAEDSYTLGKRLPDLMKGSVFTNADLMIRMNEDITKFTENNNDEPPSPEKVLEIFAVNRLLSAAEVGSLKLTAKVTEVGREGLKKGVTSALKAIGKHVVKSTGVEAAQETMDAIGQQINQKLDSEDYEGMTLQEVLEDASTEIVSSFLAGSAMGTHVGTGAMGVESAKSGMLGKAVGGMTSVVGSGLEGVKGAVRGTKEATSGIRQDVKQALGGDEEVEQNLGSIAPTEEERRAVLDNEELAQQEAARTEVKQILSAWTGTEDGIVDPGNAAVVAEKAVAAVIGNVEQFNADLTARSDISDAEKKELAASNTHEQLGHVASMLAVMRAGDRTEEAAYLSKALLERMPNMVQYFGTNPEALERFTSTVVKEVVALNSDLTAEDIGVVMNSIKKLAAEGTINDVNLQDIQKAVADAIKVGEAYKKLSSDLSTSEVSVDSATGDRGFLTYFNGYSRAIADGNKKLATGYAEQLSRFMSLMDAKAASIAEGVDRAEAVVNKAVLEVKSQKGKELSKNDLRAEVFGKLPRENIKVDYATGSGKEFVIKYTDVMDNVLGAEKPKGVYKVLENLNNEIDAMATLSDYASRDLVGERPSVVEEAVEPVKKEAAPEAAQKPSEESDKADSEPVVAEKEAVQPVKVEEVSEKPVSKSVDYSGEYIDDNGNSYLIEKVEGKEFPYYIGEVGRAEETIKGLIDKGIIERVDGEVVEPAVEAVVEEPVKEVKEEPNAVQQALEAKGEARLKAIQEAKQKKKDADNAAWEKLVANKPDMHSFLSEFSDILGNDKSIDGMIDLIEQDVIEFAAMVAESTGSKISNEKFTMSRERADKASSEAQTKVLAIKEYIKKGCKQ